MFSPTSNELSSLETMAPTSGKELKRTGITSHVFLILFNLDWTKKDDLPKIERLIQREYPKLMTVDRI
jgi:hypothetical protein